MLNFLFLILLLISSSNLTAKPADITPKDVYSQMNQILKSHAEHKEITPEIMKRALANYIEELDPTKTYFTKPDIQEWLTPSDELLSKMIDDFKNMRFNTFIAIHKKLASVIDRRRLLEEKIRPEDLEKHVDFKTFKDDDFASNEDQLLKRLIDIRSLQLESSKKLSEDLKQTAMQRIDKRRAKFEEEILKAEDEVDSKLILSNTLKALATSLDTHTVYFTPEEATQFLIGVQQKLFGIGAQLRDDINGFTIVKMVEGGPAALSKELKVKDRIIAVNGEPVVGMDIQDAVELIRGEENTPVVLTVIREKEDQKGDSEKLDITLKRGAVVLKETRFETSYEPFGDGIIAYIHLFSFYQDTDSSSAEDIAKELEKLQKEHTVKGLILDLRYNSGGMLSQAVSVTGLFITKGVVVSIKEEDGHIQHLRDLDGKTSFDGPLIVLINRASASASEIVAGTLQDYGRALIVGDDHSFGKGTFQTFTLNGTKSSDVNPKGEYKVTRGKYYTVSGKTPQLTGVISDIVIPGALSESEFGEKFSKYPLSNDKIRPNFDDDLSDIPFLQRDRIKALYKFDLQKPLKMYEPYLEKLKSNSSYRVSKDKNYQLFLKEIKKKNDEIDPEAQEEFGQNDLQLQEAFNLMKDLILLSHP